MADVKYYSNEIESANIFYCIDSNILINVVKFYFDGQCGQDKILTKQIVEFIFRCRNSGYLKYDYALAEVCFDSGSNEMNTDVMNKFMAVVDTLFLYCNDAGIENCSKHLKPYCKKRQIGDFNSVFECKLPQMIFNDQIETINVFFTIYLYFIKIYELNKKSIRGIEKVIYLYDYMTKTINSFYMHEFMLGIMLFIGTESEKGIAEGILKFDKVAKGKSSIRILINAIMDIMAYRQIHILSDMFMMIGNPVKAIFVTQDENLQKYIELNKYKGTILNGEKVMEYSNIEFAVKNQFEIEWKEFYYNILQPEMRERFLKYHMDKKEQVSMKLVFEEIERIENVIFGR